MRRSLQERVDSKTDKSAGPDGCWPWTGALGSTGTATIQIQKRNFSARRVVWELAHGETLSKDDMIDITCENRQCVNPAHLKKVPLRIEERFWTLVKKGPGCWEWQGYYFRNGYAGIKVNQKQRHASRVAWELTYGPIEGHVPGHPELEICVCHRCDNPRCVRPDHLFLGHDRDNQADKIAKGRHARGPELVAAMQRARERRLSVGSSVPSSKGLTDER